MTTNGIGPDLAEIVRRAATLWERLDGDGPAPPVFDRVLADAKLEHWCRRIAGGDRQLFDRRLAWRGWTREHCQRILGGTDVAAPAGDQRPSPSDAARPSTALPAWASTLLEISDAARAGCGSPAPASSRSPGAAPPSSAAVPSAAAVPFGPLLAPMVLVARERLRAEPDRALLSDEAHAALERDLLEHLSWIASPTLYDEFERSLPLGPDVLAFFAGLPGPPRTERFDAFVATQLADGYRGLCLAYPVLARLLATTVDHWVERTAEFLARFARDREGLRATRVNALNAGLSDSHNRGRNVMSLETDEGRRLVYKPRPVEGEALFAGLVARINGEPPSGWLALRAPAVHIRDGYGWVERVETHDCADLEEAERYFARVGQLLGLFYALQSCDVNRDNLLACGEHPVMVDGETLLSPSFAESDELPEVVRAGLRALVESVLRTSLLPSWEADAQGHVLDMTGLSAIGPDAPAVRRPAFRHVNTDSMVLFQEPGPLAPAANLPHVEAHRLSPADRADTVVCGFARTYRWLIGRADILLGEDRAPFVQAFRPRVLLRNTRLYERVILRAIQPQFMKDGFDHSVELDRISQAFLGAEAPPATFALVDSELEALERGDIPYLSSPVDSHDCGAGRGVLRESALESARRALAGLCEDDLLVQSSIVRGTLAAQSAHIAVPLDTAPSPRGGQPPGSPGMPSPRRGQPPGWPGMPSPRRGQPPGWPGMRRPRGQRPRSLRGGRPLRSLPTDLIAAASDVAAAIRSSVSRDRASWLGVRRAGESDRYRFDPLGEDLYSGRAGIAVFLAALARVTGSDEDVALVDRALGFAASGWKHAPAAWRRAWLRSSGPGALQGVASLVYALLSVARFLRRPDLLQSALDLAGELTPEYLSAHRESDLGSGAAGTLLVLLALHREDGDAGLLRRAVACGDLLVERRSGDREAPGGWPFDEGPPLAGCCHGAAGIAYALVRLWAAAPDRRYLDAAVQGIAYEGSLFDPGARNWRDLRPPRAGQATRPLMAGWCHGAPGIALARAAALEAVERAPSRGNLAVPLDSAPDLSVRDAWRRDLDAGLDTTKRHDLDDEDHLCCGNAGRVEVLWTSGLRLGRSDLQDEALRRAAVILDRARRAGGYRLAPGLVGMGAAPSLFQGSAGIGYEWLRLARPDLVPSLLLLE